MKNKITFKISIIVTLLFILPGLALASEGNPTFHLKTIRFNRAIADTTLPTATQDQKETKEKKEDNSQNNPDPQIVKVIPKARKQPIPVPVKVNIHPVKVIKPKIIRPIVKPVIKIVH
ncbi:MAG TPA: hypothetical protein VFT78_03670 [Hanamia sp.]|nr:hypothetical protein [Hanamia sp.]